MAQQYNFYDVLSDIGYRPQLYAITTLRELRSFVEGYAFALSKHSLPDESPPFAQFAEWLVRRFGRGSRSLGWWQILQQESEDDAAAIQLFGTLIDEFSLRVPTVIGEVQIDPERHTATGRFQLGYKTSDDQFVDRTQTLPKMIRIIQYATDEGCYLEYHFDETDYACYKESVAHAYTDALEDYGITDSDWQTT